MADSARFETEQEHDHAADNGDDADPVDGFDASKERGAWSVDV